MWLQSDTILWTSIGMNITTAQAKELRTRTEPETWTVFLVPAAKEVRL